MKTLPITIALTAALIIGCRSLPLQDWIDVTLPDSGDSQTTTTTTTQPPVAQWQPPAGYTADLGPMVRVVVPPGYIAAGKTWWAHSTGYYDYYERNAIVAIPGMITMFHDQHGGPADTASQIIGRYIRVLHRFPDPAWTARESNGTEHRWVARCAIIWRLSNGYTIHAGINWHNDGVIGMQHSDNSWQAGVYAITCDRVPGMTTINGNHKATYKGMPIHLRD